MVDVYSLEQLKETMRNFKQKSMHPQDNPEFAPVTWYRGQSNSKYQLVPSLYRLRLNSMDEFNNFEKNSMDNFIAKCKSLNIPMEDSSWDILYSMQHYGVKTRVLDWSANFLIGLFFAFEKWNPEVADASLYLLDPIALNFIVTKKQETFVAKKEDRYSYKNYIEAKSAGTTAIEPIFDVKDAKNIVNKRIIQQQGKFSIHDTKWPLEVEIDIRLASAQNHIIHNNIKQEDILLKINLKKEMYKEVKERLQEKGIEHTYIYPDIEGVANYVNRSSITEKEWYTYL